MVDSDLIFKALASPVRRNILAWLKNPDAYALVCFVSKEGMSPSDIEMLSGLSQSTVSNHLAILRRAGLVKARNLGQWTIFSRNETAIRNIADSLVKEL
ncbi:ArsR family transcriptional regulator [Rhizobium sp. BK313]|uniref:ArsR/SmtB family transcription factor n=1 Tax=Rhizobium sp. BK313 TaxID=2587081 RepID=UPI0010604C9E|nr:metalloregulator ArsR/SmtB family transcription factor [Rhizobium sp. BK313]MBB3452792.1 ArsR family transcriptional regulator [Rhizobium sp. BK313]